MGFSDNGMTSLKNNRNLRNSISFFRSEKIRFTG